MTGERIKRSKNLINYYGFENFFLTYGDGVGSININKLVSKHKKSSKIATVTAVKPPPRFGALKIKKNNVTNFSEKKLKIIYGLMVVFVLNKKSLILLRVKSNLGTKPEKLARHLQLNAYKHNNFLATNGYNQR